MVIKASSSAEVRSLVGALLSDDEMRREAAIARLAVIGSRATERLIEAYGAAADSAARIAILRALEPAADPRALPTACEALQRPGDQAIAAAAVLTQFLDARDPAHAAAALDALIEAALDPTRERRLRLAAYSALQDIPADMLVKVTEALKLDVRGIAREDAAYDAMIADAFEGQFPDDPVQLRDAIIARGGSAPLGGLQGLIDAVRVRERGAKTAARGAAWQQVRGAAHQALALRESRIALYDLRETVEAAEAPLPPAFLSAMRSVGDASCIEPLAAALARAPESNLWWRHQLASALRGIARRERLTKRHAAMKRALTRWPQAADAL
jgi:hypothetical protein